MKQGLALTLIMLSAPIFAADAPSSPAKADPAKGQQTVAQVCAACHGADGNSASPANPSLAGQSAAYISTQLSYFKTGVRKSPVMQGFAAALSPQDMTNVGAYFEKQAPKPQAAKDKTLAVQGEKLYRAGNTDKGVPACTACHGPNGAGIPAQFPRVAGQYADYTLAQLKAYSSGERASGNAAVMRGVAAKLSEQEMKALAEYIAGLR
ncbi:MAG TPA: c-type cytochrome [Burkholderiales bacterium]|nr:c-type cytochrome [Burkholderiales bacterium]